MSTTKKTTFYSLSAMTALLLFRPDAQKAPLPIGAEVACSADGCDPSPGQKCIHGVHKDDDYCDPLVNCVPPPL